MQPDQVVLKVGGLEIDRFVSYEITSDFYAPTTPFTVELGKNPGVDEGMIFTLSVNGLAEQRGIIMEVSDPLDSGSHSVRITGIPLIGLLDKHCLTKFGTLPKDIVSTAKQLIAGVPWVESLPVSLGKNATSKSSGTEDHKPTPGDTVFAVLNAYAVSRGLVFFGKPDGSLVFDSPIEKGVPAFSLDASIVKSGGFSRNLSGLYSEIIVINDTEDGDSYGAKVTVKNPDFPFYKPFVAAFNGNSSALKKQAETLLHQQLMQAYSFNCVVAGHAQNSNNWSVNSLVAVDDKMRGIKGTMMLHRRTFFRTREGGTGTRLVLGLPKGVTKPPLRRPT